MEKIKSDWSKCKSKKEKVKLICHGFSWAVVAICVFELVRNYVVYTGVIFGTACIALNDSATCELLGTMTVRNGYTIVAVLLALVVFWLSGKSASSTG